MSDSVDKWITGYRAAWESNDPAEVGALFTDDALYFNEPFTEPARGRDAIVARWLERADDPGTTTFEWKLLSQSDGLVFVQGETDYGVVKYSNLWIIRLTASGEASEFTEWWMDQANPSTA